MIPLLLATVAALQVAPAATPQAFRLEPGDYRWVPFTVKQIPAEVDCRFESLQGGKTLHVELLPMSEFRLFNRGREHTTLAVMQQHDGSFRRIIDHPGQYAVVIKNVSNPAAIVSLELSTDINPNASVVAKELPAHRRLTVILVSFAIFFALVTWSGLKIVKGIKPS